MPALPVTGHVRKWAGGRPRKFTKPSKVVTMTLPEETLEELTLIDQDRGQAIVKLTKDALQRNGAATPAVEIVHVSQRTGCIVISACNALRTIPFLHLVEISPGRFMLALDPGNDFKALELAVRDTIDATSRENIQDLELMNDLLEVIKRLRKTERVSMAEILFVNLKTKLLLAAGAVMEFLGAGPSASVISC